MIWRKRWRSIALAGLDWGAGNGLDGPGSRNTSEALRFAMFMGVLKRCRYLCTGRDGETEVFTRGEDG